MESSCLHITPHLARPILPARVQLDTVRRSAQCVEMAGRPALLFPISACRLCSKHPARSTCVPHVPDKSPCATLAYVTQCVHLADTPKQNESHYPAEKTPILITGSTTSVPSPLRVPLNGASYISSPFPPCVAELLAGLKGSMSRSCNTPVDTLHTWTSSLMLQCGVLAMPLHSLQMLLSLRDTVPMSLPSSAYQHLALTPVRDYVCSAVCGAGLPVL